MLKTENKYDIKLQNYKGVQKPGREKNERKERLQML